MILSLDLRLRSIISNCGLGVTTAMSLLFKRI